MQFIITVYGDSFYLPDFKPDFKSGNWAVLKSLKSFFTGVRILPQHYFDVNDFIFLFFSFFLFKLHHTK